MIPEKRFEGMLEWDPNRGDGEPMPIIVGEGQSYGWEELGAMLMSYEGFRFRLDIFDPSDEP